jgi:hypothetical protein
VRTPSYLAGHSAAAERAASLALLEHRCLLIVELAVQIEHHLEVNMLSLAALAMVAAMASQVRQSSFISQLLMRTSPTIWQQRRWRRQE